MYGGYSDGNATHINVHGMTLGCGIGLMILIIIIIILLGVSDVRVNKILTNQTNQMANLQRLAPAVGASKLAKHHKNKFSQPGGLHGNNGHISPADWGQGGNFMLRNTQFSEGGLHGGGIHSNPLLDGCGGSCASSNGSAPYDVVTTGGSAMPSQSEAAAQHQFFAALGTIEEDISKANHILDSMSEHRPGAGGHRPGAGGAGHRPPNAHMS